MSPIIRPDEFLAALAWFEIKSSRSTWIFLLCRRSCLRRSGKWIIRFCQTTGSQVPTRWTHFSFVERNEGKAIARLQGRAEACAEAFGADLKFLTVGRDGNRVAEFLLNAGGFSSLPSILTAPLCN